MADVRLTATNPENSQAVPVACNSKGELLLEQPESGGSAVQLDDGGTKQTIKSAGLGISDGLTETITLDAAGNVDASGRISSSNSYFVPSTANDGAIHIRSEGVEDNQAVITGGGSAFFNGAVAAGITSSPGPSKMALSAATGQARLAIHDLSVNSWWGVANRADTYQVQRWTGSYWDTQTSISSTGEFLNNGNATFTGDVIVGSRGQQWMIVESNGLAHLVEQTLANRLNAKREERDTKYPELRNIPGELTMIEEQLQKVMEFLRMVPEAGWEVWDGSD